MGLVFMIVKWIGKIIMVFKYLLKLIVLMICELSYVFVMDYYYFREIITDCKVKYLFF